MATAELTDSEQTQALILAALKKIDEQRKALANELARVSPGGISAPVTMQFSLDSDVESLFNIGFPHYQLLAMGEQLIRELRKVQTLLMPKSEPKPETTPEPSVN